MTTLTALAPTTHAFADALDAGEITWAEIDMPAYTPAAVIVVRTPAPTPAPVPAPVATPAPEMFTLGGKALAALAYTPTGRERNTPAAAAARAEIARRRTNKLARIAAR